MIRQSVIFDVGRVLFDWDLRYLFAKLIDGHWPEADFLIVPPGQKVIATNDDRVIGTAPV